MEVAVETIGTGGGAGTQVSITWDLFLSICDAIAIFLKDHGVVLAKTFVLWVRSGGESRLERGVSNSPDLSELLNLLLKNEGRFTVHIEGSQSCVLMMITGVEKLNCPERQTKSITSFL